MSVRARQPALARADVGRRVRGLAPEPLLERARSAQAWRLETRVRRSAAVRGAGLVFHALAPSGGDAQLQIDPPLAAERFDAVVGHLAARYRLVRAAELPHAARARRPRERVPVAVTFDDDLPSHHELAAPILARHGVTATVFLCDRHTPFWWQLLQAAIDTRAIDAGALAPVPAALAEAALQRRPGAIGTLASAIENLLPAQRDAVSERLGRAVASPPPLLSAQATAELVGAGWEIGFHTRRHDPLTTLDDDALRAALECGRDTVAAAPARTLAYPHGRAYEREARAAQHAGYVAAYTTTGKMFTEHTDAHLIGRLYPETASVGRFALGLARALAAGV